MIRQLHYIFLTILSFVCLESRADQSSQIKSAQECPDLSGVYTCDDEFVFKIKQVVDQGAVIYKINDVPMQADLTIIESERVVAGHAYHVQQQANCSQGILQWEELLICQEDVQHLCQKGEVAQIKQQRYSMPVLDNLKMNEAWSVGYGPMYKQRFCTRN